MARRYKMKKGRSKRLFSRTAAKTNSRNMQSVVMRGGIRL